MPKRRRADSTNQNPEENVNILDESGLTRSNIWLEDGNVVLQAEKTLFKIHRGFLSRISPIFADVFTMAQPDDEPTVEGCPVMQLPGDLAVDIQHALATLYDKGNMREAIPFDVVAALIRIGRKYEIDHLRREGMTRMEHELSSELDDVDPDRYWSEVAYEDGVLYRMTNFAYECDLKHLLPAAFFWSANEALDIIALGQPVKGEDGKRIQLLPKVQHICLVGRQKLLEAHNQAFEWVGEIGARSDCKDRKMCQSIAGSLIIALWKPSPDLSAPADSWDVWVVTLEAKQKLKVNKLCSSCLEYAKSTLLAKRQEFWDKLPSYFGLPSWDELKK
ncbi:hypothetical protein DFP72DRAFT_149159 [Ephemerocybe angulata]|uniref:BTB domain-containing protein n=1 Tax=Ephemerocybe angulata TaxID=980116 RepID=A0A8H6I762_9AGAR|nr:hypothetical protein DFP72DRAFT_149159 [Tulosesus angulatus]